jgi:hypothetical protein
MLTLGIILLVLGAVLAYVGRPREQLLVVAGVLIFAVGVVLLIVWAVSLSGADTAGVMVAMAVPPGRGVRLSHGGIEPLENIDPAVPVAGTAQREPVVVAFIVAAVPIVCAFVLQVLDAAGALDSALWVRTLLTGLGPVVGFLAAAWTRSQVTPTAAPMLDGETMLVPLVESEHTGH